MGQIGTDAANDTDAATKKYVDDKRCRFKDGTPSISTVDLRYTGLGGSLELYNNITFDGGAYCRDLGLSSVGKSIINKNMLQMGHLITQQSLSPALSNLFQKVVKKELIVIKGKPASFTTIYKDPNVNGNPPLRPTRVALTSPFRSPTNCQTEFTSTCSTLFFQQLRVASNS